VILAEYLQEMHPLVMAVLATIAISLLSLCGVALLAFNRWRDTAMFVMVAFAAGAMMSASFFHLLPAASSRIGYFHSSVSVMAGLSVFFILERFLHWRHCHKGHCEVHPFTTLSLVGDAVHNFLDGIVIGGAFLVSPALGLSTTAVIAAHELPQELGDFAVLVHGGYSRKRAVLLNLAVALTSVAGAITAYFGMVDRLDWIPYVMGFAAGNFLYIGSSDLIPELHKEQNLRKAVLAFGFFLLAVVAMAAVAESNHGQFHSH